EEIFADCEAGGGDRGGAGAAGLGEGAGFATERACRDRGDDRCSAHRWSGASPAAGGLPSGEIVAALDRPRPRPRGTCTCTLRCTLRCRCRWTWTWTIAGYVLPPAGAAPPSPPPPSLPTLLRSTA